MIEYLKLPYDSAGYGDFSVDYAGTTLRIKFEHNSAGISKFGELKFDFCMEYRVSGILSEQTKMGYDCVYESDAVFYARKNLKKFLFMLSGSDFQFFITSENCTFSDIQNAS